MSESSTHHVARAQALESGLIQPEIPDKPPISMTWKNVLIYLSLCFLTYKIGIVLPDVQNCCKVISKGILHGWPVLLYPTAPLTHSSTVIFLGEISQMGWKAQQYTREQFHKNYKSLFTHGEDGMTHSRISCLGCSFNHLKLTLVNLNVPKEAVEQF